MGESTDTIVNILRWLITIIQGKKEKYVIILEGTDFTFNKLKDIKSLETEDDKTDRKSKSEKKKDKETKKKEKEEKKKEEENINPYQFDTRKDKDPDECAFCKNKAKDELNGINVCKSHFMFYKDDPDFEEKINDLNN